jgi:hypothetical protein
MRAVMACWLHGLLNSHPTPSVQNEDIEDIEDESYHRYTSLPLSAEAQIIFEWKLRSTTFLAF